MRIGVTAPVQYSMFSGGATNAAIAVAEIFQGTGHSVDLINIIKGSSGSSRTGSAWWDDGKAAAGDFRVVQLPDASGYDLIVEVDRFVLPPTERRRLTRKAVWLIRHPFQLAELEASLFPTITTARDLSGISEIWMFDAVSRPKDVEAARALFGLPVRLLPYVWSPTPTRALLQDFGDLSWEATAKQHLEAFPTEPEKLPWSIHCCETNTRNSSSAVLPTVILREAARRKIPVKGWALHNMDELKKNKFFLENTLKHSTDIGPSGELLSRQRIPGWVAEPFSLVLSHLRFTTLRPALLDSLWAGIPTVFNSPLLAMVPGLERYAYTDNEISEACDALVRVQEDYRDGRGFFEPGALKKIRATLELHWGSSSPQIQRAWNRTARGLMGEALEPIRSSMKEPGLFRVGFSDMWADFQPEYNFFTLMLQAATATGGTVQVIGQPADGTEDLVIFGPFGLEWQKLPETIPKVHFTGENTVPIGGPGIVLNLGFQHFDMVNEEYLRFPLWILYIDWFGADGARLRNPLPIPLERCTKVFPEELVRKKKFCSFIVSNAGNPVRNTAFQWLSEYKQVDSAGRVFNTIGSDLFASFGGGGGELKKLEFLKDYKFSITYENSSGRGYCTEKYLHAKAAGCIPIYWGDPAFDRDFDVKGCIDARKFRTPEELVEAVRAVDENDSEWLKRFAVPALDSYKVAWARRTMAECARRIFAAVGFTEGLPRFIGATEASPAAPTEPAAAAPETLTLTPPSNLLVPVMATYTNDKFFHNLHFWLISLAGHARTIPDLVALVFLASDVSEKKLAPIREKFPFARFERVPDSDAPADFPDFWAAEHYGFKLWIYNHLTHRDDLADRTVLYTDVASFLCRWPLTWMDKARVAGLAMLEDPREENARWCSPSFQVVMETTEAELAAPQRLGGLVCFRAGSELACRVFSEAYRLGQQRAILAGPKWYGNDASGRPTGHRHDQSILSILALRNAVPTEPLDSVYCDKSLRVTHKTGRCIYVHRGNFQVHRPFAPGIDEVYMINLERRKDRMDRFYASHPDLSGVVERWPAIDGRALSLTPALAQLLRPNDFFWKKAVTGCALSHLGLWMKLVTEQPEIKSFLILEDDVKFRPGWLEAWREAEAAGAIPDDADLVYLGGVLPPNREGFETAAKERVNAHVSRVAPNVCFGQKEPTRYFHFCAYAYVLTRRGAEKVIGLLNGAKGYWTSADHILCNPVDVLTSYLLDPLVAGCYQEDDPKYATSEFNNFDRVDNFDSDLWNNDERFDRADIEACLAAGAVRWPDELPFEEAIADARRGGPVEVDEVIGSDAVGQKIPTAVTIPRAQEEAPRFLNRPIVAYEKLALKDLYEYEWLMNLFGKPTLCEVEQVAMPTTDSTPRTDEPLVILQGKSIPEMTKILDWWSSSGSSFYILHLSDEWGTDPIEAYDLSGCLGIIRTYQRTGLQGNPNILTIPIGYHFTLQEGSKHPGRLTPHLPFRQLDWSFFGTGWKERGQLLDPLRRITNNRIKLLEGWNDPEQAVRSEYISTMLNSVFVPCPEGMNPETFRFYEALECGAVPIVVETEKAAAWIDWLKESLPLLTHTSWEEAGDWMRTMLQNKETLEEYRTKLLDAWVAWRARLQEQVGQWICAKAGN